MVAASSLTDRQLPIRPLLTGQEVGEVLGYTPRQVRSLAAAGQLRRVVLGHRSTRYLAEDVEAYISRHTLPTTSSGAPPQDAAAKTAEVTGHAQRID